MYFPTYFHDWAQRTKLKPYQTMFDRTYSNLTSYIILSKYFLSKKLKYFHDFQNRNFSVLWLKWTEAMEMKHSQTFFQGKYSNVTSFFIGCKMVTYFNNFPISSQKWAQINKMKWNETGHAQIWQHFSLFRKYYGIWMTFEIYFLTRFISKVNDNNFDLAEHI